MTPWLTVSVPIQPSKPERLPKLAQTLGLASSLAAHPEQILWQVAPCEDQPWTLAEKQRHAFRVCTTPWIMILSDDVTCVTKHWDVLFKAKTNDPDALVIYGPTGLFTEWLSPTGCLRRDFIQALEPDLRGYAHYQIDDHWHDQALKLKGLRYVPEVQFIWDEAWRGVPYVVHQPQFDKDQAEYRRLEPQRLSFAEQWPVALKV